MTKRWTLIALATFVLTISSAMVAQAQTGNRLYLASTGNDANNALTPPCPQATPCKSAGGVIGHVNAGGTIVVLDSEGIGGVAISQSVTIEGAPGVTGHIVVVSGAVGISITGGTLVVLRNIEINGLGASNTTGIFQNGGNSNVVVQNCKLTQLTTGINVAGSGGNTAKMDLINSDIFNCGTAVSSNGQGANAPGNPAATAQALVRINGGNITGNTTGLSMVSPGTGSGQPLFNIFLFAGPGGVTLNLASNGTGFTCSVTPMCNSNIQTYTWSTNVQ